MIVIMSKTRRSGNQSESQGTDFEDSLVENIGESLEEGNTSKQDLLPSSQGDEVEGLEGDHGADEASSVAVNRARKKGAAKTKKTKALEEPISCCTERDPLPRAPLPTPDGGRSFTALSWNVNGLRATVKNGLDVLRRMVKTERPDLVCIQVKS